MRFVIIGNGIAGNTAADTIRKLDRDADIALISDRVHSFYTACALPHFVSGELSKRQLFVKNRRDYRRGRLKPIFGQRVVSLNSQERKVILERETLDYDRLVIATGSRPTILPIDGVKLAGVHTFKYLDDAVDITKETHRVAVVLGSGPIGIEAGIALKKRGLKVYVIELMDRIMPRLFDAEPASMLRDILARHEVEALIGERALRVTGTDKVEGIVTDKRTIPCDLVIMAAGMRPNSEIAKEAGIAVGARGGVMVDRHMETSAAGVYACGDCVEAADLITGGPSMIQLWHNAKEEAEVAAFNAVGEVRNYAGSINITSLDVFENHAVSFGTIEADLGGQNGIQVLEKKHAAHGYHRLVLKQGQIVGAQFVGDMQDMGSVLYALIRKDRLDELKEFGEGRPASSFLNVSSGVPRFLAGRRLAQQA